MKKGALLVLFCLSLNALVLGGCAPHGGMEPGTLRVNLGAEPPSLDWHTSTDATSFDVVNNIMVGLTQYNEKLQSIPAVATNWDVTDGGRRYLFHLRGDVKWSDGKPVRAQDFEYAWKRLLDPQTAAQYAFFLYGIEGAEEFNTGRLKDSSQVGVKAIDDRTLEVRLKQPEAYFIYLTSYAPCYPMRKDVVKKFDNRWTEPGNIVTDGPFLLRAWQHEYKIELASNPHYFEGEPRVKVIKMFMVPEQSTAFALYQNNELDFIDNRSFSTPDLDQSRHSPEFHSYGVLRNTYIGFNFNKPPFTDARVRKAFSLALERTVYPAILRRGEKPLYTWIPPQLPGYAAGDGTTYNPQLARTLLQQAGFADGQNFPSLSLLLPNREDTKLFAEKVQDQLKTNLNVHVELQTMEWKMFLETLHRDPPPLFYSSWGADFPDPETFANVFTSENGNNDLKYHNPVYDKLVAQAEAEQNQERRAELYSRADKLLCVQDAALAPVMQAAQNIMVKPWVHGVSENALDLQFFRGVWIAQP